MKKKYAKFNKNTVLPLKCLFKRKEKTKLVTREGLKFKRIQTYYY